MTNQELSDYYSSLLIAQWFGYPNATGHIGVLADAAIASQIIAQVRDGYGIEDAIGAQLDIIGKYVGVSRRVNGLDITRTFFTMPKYGDVTVYPGFSIYGTTPTSFFRSYADSGSTYNMTDYEYRQLLKLRIRKNMFDGSLEDIDDIIDEFFGADCLVTDGLDMTLTYAFTPGLTYNLPKIAAFTKSLLYPAGVDVTITGI